MTKHKDWQIFRTASGQVAYNQLCLRCVHPCKQSWQAEILDCPRFQRMEKQKKHRFGSKG